MTFRPYTGKVRLGNSETFLDISELPDGYVLSREGTQIIATLIGQDKLSLAEPSKSGDAATKGYVDSEISSAESALQSSLTSETSSRLAGDAAEASARAAAITSEASSRLAGDAAEASARAAAITSETSSRLAGDAAEASARAAAISAEASTREAADGALGLRIDNILSNVTQGSLDSLTEIVSAFQSADGYLTEMLTSLSTGNSSALVAETSARVAADSDLSGRISSEASTRAAADSAFETSLGNETSARIAEDGYLHGLIVDEAERAAGAEEALQGNIDAEASTRAAAVLSLQGDVAGEESARAAQDTVLQGNITAEASARAAADLAIAGDLDLEESARAAQDTVLQGNITAEASARAAADLAIAGDLDLEESARAAQDTVLQGSIDTEASTRAAADLAITGDLDLEESARIAGDTAEASARAAAISSEASTRAAADLALAGDLDLEESARIAGDTAEASARAAAISSEASTRAAGDAHLQGQINDILSNVDPDSLDSLTEIVSAFQSADGYLTEMLTSLSTGNSSALVAETSARVAADGVLQGNIDAEASTRAAADLAIAGDLDLEESARAAADLVLQGSITSETSTRAAADLAIAGDLDIEESARAAADLVLQGSITAEASTRAAADLVLQGNITAEESARVAADATKLSLSGGTMTGAIGMGSNKITGLAAGTDANDAVTLSQLQSAVTAIDPAGSIGQIQFNADGYDFGASANLAWDNAQNSLFVGGATKVNGVVSLGEVSEVPSSEAGYGKLFAKNDDGLYFVDSEGVNHYILLDGYVELSGTSVALDASPSLPVYRSLTMTGATTFTTSNLGVGRSVSVRLVAGASERTVSFPAGWSWLGGATPTSVPANKVAMLSFVSYGAADTDVVAAWSYNDSTSISGGGTTGQVAFYDGTRSVAGEANLTWDAENDRLVVGTVASPAANLHVGGSAQIDGAVTLGDGYADAITVNGTATFNEPVSMGSNKITDLATPSSDNDAVNVAFLESRRRLTIQTIAGTGTVNADTDVVFVTGSGGGVVRLPQAVAGNTGKVVVIKKRNSGSEDNVGTASGSGQSIDGAVADSSSNLQELMLENESLTFLSDGSNWFII